MLHSNAILQPSQSYCAQPSGAGVFPLQRPPVSVATSNLLERPVAMPKAHETWSKESVLVPSMDPGGTEAR